METRDLLLEKGFIVGKIASFIGSGINGNIDYTSI